MDDIEDEVMGVGKVKVPDLWTNFYEVEEEHRKWERQADRETR